MKKRRVHELAKELGVSNKDLLDRIHQIGIPAKSHSSSIMDLDVVRVRESFGVSDEQKKPIETPPPAILKMEEKAPSSEIKKVPTAPQSKEPLPVTMPVSPLTPEVSAVKTAIKLTEPQIVVKDLAERLAVKNSDVIKVLMQRGKLITLNQVISAEEAVEVGKVVGIEVIMEEVASKALSLQERLLEEEMKQSPENMRGRPPVVTVMGHVDHGKTKLLDAIRKTNVMGQEAGSITQHIGAYQVEVGGKKITFLDTPGHEAFTTLRARGAQVTDIAILVVAADDGVMPQTIEAIHHAQAAGVPIMVALNKMDKPGINPDRVKQQLSEHQLVPEDWGGKTVVAPISAKQGTGIDQLLEMILLVADMQELRANPDKQAMGVVVESRLDKGRGPVASVLVRSGTLHVGDIVVAGSAYGKIRALLDYHGNRLSSATPSMPAEVLGFSEVPQPGDIFQVESSEKTAKKRVEMSKQKNIEEGVGQTTLEKISQAVREGGEKELRVVLKADVQGSLEAIIQSLQQKQTEKVKLKFLHAAVGAIGQGDILLAEASKAIVTGFGVEMDETVKKLAVQEGVDVRTYDIIYKLIEDIEKAMNGLLEPEKVWVAIGEADVRQIFHYSKVGTIAGCFVSSGKFRRGVLIRISRNGKQVWEGKLESLKRFKEDVREVAQGFECGIAITGMNDFQVGDHIQALEQQEKVDRA